MHVTCTHTHIHYTHILLSILYLLIYLYSNYWQLYNLVPITICISIYIYIIVNNISLNLSDVRIAYGLNQINIVIKSILISFTIL